MKQGAFLPEHQIEPIALRLTGRATVQVARQLRVFVVPVAPISPSKAAADAEQSMVLLRHPALI